MEAISNGEVIRLIDRRPQPEPIKERPDLTSSQLEWLAARHPGIFRNRFEPLERSHEQR